MKHVNQKGFVNIILILVIVVLAGTVGYFTIVKKSGPPTPQISPIPTFPTTSSDQSTTVSQSGKVVIQKLILNDGSSVSLISSNSIGQSSNLNKIFNCKLPAEIETVNVSLEYEGKTTSLGFIGIPKKSNGNFPIIENTINYGLENLVKFLEWSPLQKLVRGFGVIDYFAVKSVDPRSKVNLEKPGYEGATQIALAACYLDYKMLFFEVDTTTKTLKLRDTGTGIHFYEDLERFKKEITPGCSPFGCG